MAVFIDIRNKLGPIIVIIIGLSLALFVLETAFNSNTSLFHGNRDVVGEIDGDKINYRDYNEEVQKETEAFRLNYPNQQVNDFTTNSLRQQSWNKLVYDKIKNNIYDKLGIAVSNAEVSDMLFVDPVPQVRKSFTNPNTNVFDAAAVKNHINTLDRSNFEGDNPVTKRANWINFENYIYEDRLETKVKDMFRYGIYVPKWMAEQVYTDMNTKLNFDYISIPFSSIPDSSIKVTDDDIKDYLDRNKEKFKQEGSRKIDYVIFKINPSSEDTMKALKFITESYNKLSPADPDTDYIKINSQRGLDKFYYAKDKVFEEPLKDTLFKVAPGTTVGPIYKDGVFYAGRLIDKKQMPDSVKTSIIAIAKQGADSVKQAAKADSIYKAIMGGASFEELAKKYSDDKNSGSKGGDYGFVKQGMMPTDMNDFLFFQANQGDVKFINSHSQKAFFIIKAVELQKVNYSIRYYSFSGKIESSQKTYKAVYAKANNFVSKNSSDQAFVQAFKTDAMLNKQTATVGKGDYQVTGLENARELITWGYKNSLGAVSGIMQSGENYVIGHISEIREKGLPTAAEVRPQVEPLIRNEKKGQKIAAQIASATSLNSTMEAIATKFNVDIKNISSADFNQSYIMNLGEENALLGTLASLKEGQVSRPVVGNSGVFVAKLNSVAKPQPIADYNAIKRQQWNNLQMRAQYGSLIEALKKKMNVEDYRYNFE